MPWRCPNSTLADRHHVLQATSTRRGVRPSRRLRRRTRSSATIVAWRGPPRRLRTGMTDAARAALVCRTRRGGPRRRRRRIRRHAVRSARTCSPTSWDSTATAGVWVKDETGGVGGSQKARHLLTILLHLRALELLGELPERPPLAIASCGNAALAAATLARAADWPIDVYVPTWMSDGFGDRLDELRAHGPPLRAPRRRSAGRSGDAPLP